MLPVALFLSVPLVVFCFIAGFVKRRSGKRVGHVEET